MMDDITAIATENLKNRTAWLKTRCVARAGTQYAVTEGLGLALDQAVGGWQGQLLGALLKGTREGAGNADLRQWRTLPARISTGRILAPHGPRWLKTVSMDLEVLPINRYNQETYLSNP